MAKKEGKERGGLKAFSRDLRSNRIYLILLLPAVVYALIFSYAPMAGVLMAFQKYNFSQGLLYSPWVGLKNFRFLTVSNKLWPLTRNTLLYNLAFIVVGMVMEVGFAIIINEMRCRWFKKVFQSFIFLPYFISWVIASAVVQTLLDFDTGLNSRIVKSLGLPMVNVYVDKGPWPFLLVFFRMWKGVGYGSIIYLGTITGISDEYFEAAVIDGASKWQQIVHITLPFLKSMIIILTIMAVGSMFHSSFDLFYQVPQQSGQLLKVTNTIDVYVYTTLKQSMDIGLSSAVALFQSITGFVLVLLTNQIVRWVDKELSMF